MRCSAEAVGWWRRQNGQRSSTITKICIVSDTVDDTHIVPHIPAPTFDRASRSRATLLQSGQDRLVSRSHTTPWCVRVPEATFRYAPLCAKSRHSP